MRTDTQTLIKSLLILAEEIQSEDGVANAAIHEAALRMEGLVQMLDDKDDKIQELADLKADQVQEHAEEMLKIIEERDDLESQLDIANGLISDLTSERKDLQKDNEYLEANCVELEEKLDAANERIEELELEDE